MDKQKFTRRVQHKIPARLHMSLICLVTIASGILISKGLLWLQLSEPTIRYSIAVLFSYGVFFALVYWWLQIHFDRRKKVSPDYDVDTLDVVDMATTGMSASHPSTSWAGGGGESSGGGASTSWCTTSSSAKSSSSIDLGDFDEGAIIILFIAVLAAIFGSAGYLIYQAPEILFEAAFEVVLVAGLAKQAKKMQAEGWHYSIFKRTWWLCAIVLVCAIAFGLVIKAQCPDAVSFAQYREICLNKKP